MLLALFTSVNTMGRQECYWWQECAASVITSASEDN